MTIYERDYWLLWLTLFSFTTLASGATELPRSHESFNQGWRFARYGSMPHGSKRPEPGAPQPRFKLIASSEQTDMGHLAELAMDGDPGTRWCALGPDANQWLLVDLGSARELGSIAIQWEREQAYRFAIEGSLNRQAWQMLADLTRNTNAAQPTCALLSGNARYLRVRITGLPAGSWASIAEITLMDSKGNTLQNRQEQPAQTRCESATFDDSAWRELDVPHDWGIEGPFRYDLEGNTGKLPWRGIGWYRKHFTPASGEQGKRWFVDFDGAMAHAEVWLNGQYLGTWPYGYASFRMELTPHLKFGQDNVLAVRLDTEKWGSRWYPGAGIYRNVWLVKTEPVHVTHWGT